MSSSSGSQNDYFDPGSSFNYPALYDQLTKGDRAAAILGAVGQWERIVSLFDSATATTNSTLQQVAAVWEGQAADAFQDSVAPLSQWADTAGSAADAVTQALQGQAEAFIDLVNALPIPVRNPNEFGVDDWENSKHAQMEAIQRGHELYADYAMVTAERVSQTTGLFPSAPQLAATSAQSASGVGAETRIAFAKPAATTHHVGPTAPGLPGTPGSSAGPGPAGSGQPWGSPGPAAVDPAPATPAGVPSTVTTPASSTAGIPGLTEAPGIGGGALAGLIDGGGGGADGGRDVGGTDWRAGAADGWWAGGVGGQVGGVDAVLGSRGGGAFSGAGGIVEVEGPGRVVPGGALAAGGGGAEFGGPLGSAAGGHPEDDTTHRSRYVQPSDRYFAADLWSPVPAVIGLEDPANYSRFDDLTMFWDDAE